MDRTTRQLIAPGILAALLLAVLGAVAVLEAQTEAVCGQRPQAGSSLAGPWALLTGDTGGYVVPEGCVMPVAGVRIGLVVLLVLLGVAALAGMILWARYKQSDKAFIRELRDRPGFARRSELRKYFSARTMVKRAPQLRPDLGRPATAYDVAWPVGMSRYQLVYVSIEDSVLLIGPPRQGKGFRVLISAILDWSGPLITTSTTTDNLAATYEARAARGRVYVFDPQGLTGREDVLRIDPIRGCEDPRIATERGKAIINGTALGASARNAEWADVAARVLARLLHAAAISGGTVEDLFKWGSNPDAATAAVQRLRDHGGAAGWAGALEGIITGDPKMRANVWFGVETAVAPLALPHVREALTPRPDDEPFDPRAFLSGENTLYLLGTGIGSQAMGGFLAAVLDDIVERAREMALASKNSRLAQPLGLILDEIANMFRWERLPVTMADGGGRGICTFVVLQDVSQAESSWSSAEASTVWSTATAKILLGGSSNTDHLGDIERLLGERETQRESRSWSTEHYGQTTNEQEERRAVMSVSELRRMPESLGLLFYRNRRPVLLDLRGWTQRRDARKLSAGRARVEAQQQAAFQAKYAPAATEPSVSDEDLDAVWPASEKS